MNKIAPRSIKIHRIEGAPQETAKPHYVETWQQANALLWSMSGSVPKGGSDKVNFWIEFADGSTYAGRLDLKPYTAPRLDSHVREFCLFMAGSRKPAYMSAADYTRALADYPAQMIERYRRYVTHYSLNAYETDALA